jgi:DNA gyrase subunit A
MSDTSQTPPEDEALPGITLEDEMKRSYLDYAMSVIVSRALPDVRDGLKPVHRRILYAMQRGGYTSDKPYKKSARIVGDVMGQFHPHGDSAIYDALVRMAQDFSMRIELIDGQGNFGSMDGDPAAAMRYTEARMAKAAEALLEDIDKNTVDFYPNYDETTQEPEVLPAKIPNLLVNGAGGIAVGMATNIPPHNLGEVLDACKAYIDNPQITGEELLDYIPGPDFPTGGQVLGKSGVRAAYMTGNGSVVVRAKTTIEEPSKNREAIVVHEVPYQVNKGRLLERLGEVAREKIVEGISEIRDESDKDGVRVVIDVKRDAQGDIVLNQLFKHTQLQTSFGCNMVALNFGRPQMLVLRDLIETFITFREEVITRRTIYELGKARERAHTLIGLAVAVANIDDVIALIRNAPDPQTAREELLARTWDVGDVAPLIELVDDPEHPVLEGNQYQMSYEQAKAILELRLHRLTGLERDKIGQELQEITDRIAEYLEILASREKLLDVLRGELDDIRERFATPRRTELVDAEFEQDVEDLIQREDMVVAITHGGYAKRTPLATYRAQRRGGKGRTAMNMKEEDFVSDLFVASTHTPILFFTSRGIVHRLKVYQLPMGGPNSRGKALVNLLPLQEDEHISVIMRLPEDEEMWDDLDIVLATSSGSVRRNNLSDFRNIRANGLIAMKLNEREDLVSAKIAKEDEDILLASRKGKAIRFAVPDVRVFSGRTSTGVRGIKLGKGDEVIAMCILKQDDAQGEQNAEQTLLCVTEKGYGKRTYTNEYRRAGRGGQGVFNMNVTDKTGEVVSTFPVTDQHQVMLVTDQGQMIRTSAADVRRTGRSTQGVRLLRVGQGEKVVSVAWLVEEGEDEPEDVIVDTGAQDPESMSGAETPDAEDGQGADNEAPDEE